MKGIARTIRTAAVRAMRLMNRSRIFGPNVAADVETELVFHLDMRTQELIDGDVRLSVTWTERRPQTAERACHRDG
jgi:hypothetical protein